MASRLLSGFAGTRWQGQSTDRPGGSLESRELAAATAEWGQRGDSLTPAATALLARPRASALPCYSLAGWARRTSYRAQSRRALPERLGEPRLGHGQFDDPLGSRNRHPRPRLGRRQRQPPDREVRAARSSVPVRMNRQTGRGWRSQPAACAIRERFRRAPPGRSLGRGAAAAAKLGWRLLQRECQGPRVLCAQLCVELP